MNDSMSKILLVDDEEDLTDLVRYHLETESFAVDSQIEGKDLRVLLEDNGTGIPDGDLPRIFERLYRVEKGRSRDKGDTGQGLSIVKRILSVHGGAVQAINVGGRGLRIFITIPISDK